MTEKQLPPAKAFQLLVALEGHQRLLKRKEIPPDIRSISIEQISLIQASLTSFLTIHNTIEAIEAAIQAVEPGHPTILNLGVDLTWFSIPSESS